MGANKAWIDATLAHRETEAVPYNFMFTPPAARRLLEHYGGKSVAELLNMPIRMMATESPKPLYASPADYGPTITDEFGVVWNTSDLDRGAPLAYSLREPDLSRVAFPDPNDPARFARLPAWCAANREHYTVIWIGALWERATFMRGMEPLLLDLALERAFVEELLERLTEYILRTMEILFATCEFDCCALSDDYGSQKSLLMSPDDWRTLIKPRVARIIDLARRHGRTTFLHSCGHVAPIIGDLIDIGLDVLHPIQPETMDILALKREYGRDITFCGGVRTQDLLPAGTPRQVREEVRRLKREMGAGGGYILEPGITIQVDVPLDNMIALVEEARDMSP